jgi:DNA-binding transcriptional ArsR family regulator
MEDLRGRAAGRTALETPHAVRGKVRRSALVPFPDLNSPLRPSPSPRSGRSAGNPHRSLVRAARCLRRGVYGNDDVAESRSPARSMLARQIDRAVLEPQLDAGGSRGKSSPPAGGHGRVSGSVSRRRIGHSHRISAPFARRTHCVAPQEDGDPIDGRHLSRYLSIVLNIKRLRDVQSTQHLTQTFAALGDATRMAILARLAAQGDLTVQEIAEPFAMSLPAVSQHLKVLERAGLIARGRDGQKRPCSLRTERLAEATRWLNHTREAWEARFDRLERFLATTEIPQSAETKGDDHER